MNIDAFEERLVPCIKYPGKECNMLGCKFAYYSNLSTIYGALSRKYRQKLSIGTDEYRTWKYYQLKKKMKKDPELAFKVRLQRRLNQRRYLSNKSMSAFFENIPEKYRDKLYQQWIDQDRKVTLKKANLINTLKRGKRRIRDANGKLQNGN